MEPKGLAVFVLPALCNTTGRSAGSNRELKVSHFVYAVTTTGLLFNGSSPAILNK